MTVRLITAVLFMDIVEPTPNFAMICLHVILTMTAQTKVNAAPNPDIVDLDRNTVEKSQPSLHRRQHLKHQ